MVHAALRVVKVPCLAGILPLLLLCEGATSLTAANGRTFQAAGGALDRTVRAYNLHLPMAMSPSLHPASLFSPAPPSTDLSNVPIHPEQLLRIHT